MSSEESDDNNDDGETPQTALEDADENTLRVLISTDNHLGYAERDPVRGMDSFAAFEEVLYLAKRYKCDMVLLAGDLFHENRPSRQTLYKALQILRKYCLGEGAVQIQLLSDAQQNFPTTGVVNYQDPNYAVDLPLFSIHGNHDDPVREGTGQTPLAALGASVDGEFSASSYGSRTFGASHNVCSMICISQISCPFPMLSTILANKKRLIR